MAANDGLPLEFKKGDILTVDHMNAMLRALRRDTNIPQGGVSDPTGNASRPFIPPSGLIGMEVTVKAWEGINAHSVVTYGPGGGAVGNTGIDFTPHLPFLHTRPLVLGLPQAHAPWDNVWVYIPKLIAEGTTGIGYLIPHGARFLGRVKSSDAASVAAGSPLDVTATGTFQLATDATGQMWDSNTQFIALSDAASETINLTKFVWVARSFLRMNPHIGAAVSLSAFDGTKVNCKDIADAAVTFDVYWSPSGTAQGGYPNIPINSPVHWMYYTVGSKRILVNPVLDSPLGALRIIPTGMSTPLGWALCDGAANTFDATLRPGGTGINLQGKFVAGQGVAPFNAAGGSLVSARALVETDVAPASTLRAGDYPPYEIVKFIQRVK